MSIFGSSNNGSSSSFGGRAGKNFALSQAVDTARYASGNLDGDEYGQRTAANAASAVAGAAGASVGGPAAGFGAAAVADKAVSSLFDSDTDD